jgi:hypothetical protein
MRRDRFDHPRFDFGDEPKPSSGSAKAARDEALKRVLEHSKVWAGQALAYIDRLDPGWEGITEDLRMVVDYSDIGKPHHHNVWGSLTANALRKSLFEPTGELRHMKTKKSHARRTPVYRRTTVRL